MEDGQQSLKKLANIAFMAMGALLILAILCYKERILFADASYISFHIVNERNLCVQEQRYGSFITQLFPYLCQKMHLPLRAILLAYSLSFNAFFLSVNAILVYVFRQYRLAILMALYYFLFISESFAWPGNEIHQAVAWMFLFFGAIVFLGSKKVNIMIVLFTFLLLAFLTISTHFVVVIPLVFLWVYLIIEKQNWPFGRNTTIMFSAALIAIAVAYIAIKHVNSSGAESYDSVHLRGLTHFSIHDVLVSFTTPVVKKFLYRCLMNYWLGTIICVASIAILIKQQKKRLAGWTVISILGYIIVMGLTYGDLDSSTGLFHIESEWACMGIIVAMGFVFSYLPGIKHRAVACLLIGIFAVRLVYIVVFLGPFTKRITMTEQILTCMRAKGITKLAIYNDDRLMSEYKLYWGLPYESVFLSSMAGEKPQRTFTFVNPGDSRTLELLKNPKGFYDAYFDFPCSNLNKEYFVIDSTKPYQVMTYAELLK